MFYSRQAKILGGVAQLGERLICIQKVAGSIPVASTILTVKRFSALTNKKGQRIAGLFEGKKQDIKIRLSFYRSFYLRLKIFQ